MRGCLLVVLVGCAADPGGAQQTLDPHACAATVALDGGGAAQPAPVGPVTIGTAGVDVCMHLDTTHNLVSAHFAATTPAEVGAMSSFVLQLVDAAGTPLVEGGDVTVGQTHPQSHATLEYSFAVGQVLDARLHVSARAHAASAMVELWLFEPYE